MEDPTRNDLRLLRKLIDENKDIAKFLNIDKLKKTEDEYKLKLKVSQ